MSTPLVQCGWCPTIMADDYPVIYLHNREVHGRDGYSVRPIKGTDWDIAELWAAADLPEALPEETQP